MAPLLYIVVRKTTDWGNEAAVRAQLPPGFAPLYDLWNATFAMPYHRFRVELKRIAERSLAQVEDAVVAPFAEVPEGARVAPIDDDDWFAPHLARALGESVSAATVAWRWRSRFLEVPPNFDQWLGVWQRRLLGTPPIWSCTTNNHAFAKRAAAEALVASHIRASEWFDAHAADVQILGASLSVQNRNLASQTSLLFGTGTQMSAPRLRRRHRRYRRLYAKPPAAGLEWSQPYIAAMAELMRELRLR